MTGKRNIYLFYLICNTESTKLYCLSGVFAAGYGNVTVKQSSFQEKYCIALQKCACQFQYNSSKYIVKYFFRLLEY